AGFGCAKGLTCNVHHQCEKAAAPAPAKPPTDPAAPVINAQEGTLPPSSGDDGESAPVTTGDDSSDPNGASKALPKSSVASSGCSASSSKSAGRNGAGVMPLLAIAAALSFARRRSRKRR